MKTEWTAAALMLFGLTANWIPSAAFIQGFLTATSILHETMDTEPLHTSPPEPNKKRTPVFVWLLVALSPSVLVMLALQSTNLHFGIGARIVTFGLNPLIAGVACYRLTDKPGSHKSIPIAGGILFGAAFAVLNLFIGALAGCVCRQGGF